MRELDASERETYLEQAALVFGVSLTTAEIALGQGLPPVPAEIARGVEDLLWADACRRWPRGFSPRWRIAPCGTPRTGV